MAGFQKDVTGNIGLPKIQAPNFAQNRSAVEDIADIASFGVGIYDRVQKEKQFAEEESAKRKEKQRLEQLNKDALGIVAKVDSARDSGLSDFKQMEIAKREIKRFGGGMKHQAELQKIVANISFGAPTLGVASKQSQERYRGELRAENNSLGAFSDIAIHELYKGSSVAELDNAQLEKVNEKARELHADALNSEKKRKEGVEELNKGDYQKGSGLLETHRKIFSDISGIMVTLYDKQLDLTIREGRELGDEEVLNMKQDAKVTLQRLKTNMMEDFSSPDTRRFMESGTPDGKGLKESYDSQLKLVDAQIKMLDEMEADAFKSYADLLQFMKNKDGIDLQRSAKDFLRIKELYGSSAIVPIIQEQLVKDPSFREVMRTTTNKALLGSVSSASDIFAINMGIISGIGEGKSILDYDSDNANDVANKRWSTVGSFIKNPAFFANITEQEVFNKHAIAAVDVLEFAEERGQKEDKERALTLLNSDGFRNLYNKVSPEIQESLGRKVLQYNRDVLNDDIEKALKLEQHNISKTSYNATTSRFEVDSEQEFNEFRKGTDPTYQEFKANVKRAEELNNKLDVMKRYAKDDPFLKDLNGKQVTDFFIANSDTWVRITGKLSTFTEKQKEAQQQGISLADLENIEKEATQGDAISKLFRQVKSDVLTGSLPENTVKAIESSLKGILSGNPEATPTSPQNDFSDMNDEEKQQLIDDIKASMNVN